MRQTGSGRVSRNRTVALLAVVLLCGLLIAGPAAAMKNPSAVYCEALGYQYVTVTTQDGGEAGQCRISATEQVSAWKFLQGDVAQDKSYCAQQGLEYRKVTDPEVCREFGLDSCMVCIAADGKPVEVTRLMNLSFDEGVCGDGICAMAENTGTCPKDCMPGGADGFCDGLQDQKCDPDCTAGGDADCTASKRVPIGTATILAAISVAALASAGMRRK